MPLLKNASASLLEIWHNREMWHAKTAAHFKFNRYSCFEYINVYKNALPHIFSYNLLIIIELFSIYYLSCIKDNGHFNDNLTACVGFVSQQTYMWCAFIISVYF